MSKAEERAKERYWLEPCNIDTQNRFCAYIEGYQQAEKDVAEAFAKIIRSNLGGIGNGIQNMFEQLYIKVTGEKMYKGFTD